MQVFELTQASQKLFERACAVSTRLRHHYVEPEHFVLAMVIDVNTRLARMLHRHGMNPDTVLDVVIDMHEIFPQGQERVLEHLTQASTKIINTSISFAWRQHKSLATPEHILVMLIESKNENVRLLFKKLGVNPDRVSAEATEMILSTVN